MTYDPEAVIAVTTTPAYNSSGAVWAVAKIGPFATKTEAKAAADRMLAAEIAGARG